MADNFTTTFQVLVQGLSQAQQYAQALHKIATAQQAAVNSAKGLNANLPRITTGVTHLDKAGNKITRTLTTVNGRLVAMTTHVDSSAKGMNRAARQVDALSHSWGLLSRVIIGSVVARAIGQLIGGLREGISTAVEFNLRIGEIRTVSQGVNVSVDRWTASVRALSDAYGTDLLDTAEGVYQTISNQTAFGAEATYFMAEAQKFATVAVTDTANAVELLSGAINAYGQDANKADEYAAILFKGIELGRFRAEEIANTMGRVNAVAAQLGVPLEEVTATLATLTRQGVKVNEAMTYLRNIFQKLVRPSDHMKKSFDAWGVSSGAHAIKTLSLIEVMQRLNEEADASGDALAEIGSQWQRIRSVIGAVALRGAGGEWAADIEAIGNAAGDTDEALKRMLDTPGFQLRKELTQIKNIFTVDFGNEIVKTLADINKNFINISDSIQFVLVNGGKIGTITVLVLGLKGAWVGLNSAMLKAMLLNPATWFIAVAAASYIAVEAFWNMRKGIAESTDESVARSQQNFVEIRKNAINMATDVGDATKKMLSNQISEFDRASARLRGIFNEYMSLADLQRDIASTLYEATAKYATPLERVLASQDMFAKTKTRVGQMLKENDFEGALKAAKELESVIANISKGSGERVRYDSRLNMKVAGPTEFRNGVGTAALQKRYEAELMAIYRAIQAQATKEGDFTGLTTKQFEEQFKALEKAKEPLNQLTDLIEQNTERVAGFRKTAVEYARQIEEAFTRMTGTLGMLDENHFQPGQRDFLGGYFPLKGADKDALDRLAQAQRELHELQAASKASGKPFDLDQATRAAELVERMSVANAQLREAGVTYSLKGWPAEMESVLAGMESAAKFMVAQTQAAEAGETKLQLMNRLLPEANGYVDQMYEKLVIAEQSWDKFGTTGAQKIKTLNELIIMLHRNLNAFNAKADNAAASRIMPTGTNAVGGIIKRFVAGGSVGSDTIAAMLSPGEFVTSRAATRKFLPLLSAMNSGSTRMASGGAVTNNVGDVNVTVQGGNTSEATVRQIGNALRREFQRGNIRLN